jgi:bla regulator protein BlaR1
MDAIASHIWQSTIFAAAAGTLALMFRNNSASVRYWIWFSAAVKFLVPLAALAAIANRIPMPQASDAATRALDAATLVFRTSALPETSGSASLAVFTMWLSGAVAVLARSAWQWQRLTAHARQSLPIVDGVVYDALRSIERAEGIENPITIVGASRPLEPGVIGIWKPVLMWPQHLTAALTGTQIETVVAHEVFHIVRRDNLFASVQIVATAVFWFHPIVWWIGARLIDERERACDECVLAAGRRPATYAESILKTCRLCLSSPPMNAAGVTGGDLKQRIARIMRNEPSRPLDARRKAVLLVAALALLLLPTAAGVSACLPRRNVEAPKTARLTLPKLIRETKPHYTARAMGEKVEGEVLMECVVKADGTVGDRKILKSLHPDLDQAALDAAASWLFEPGTRNGKPANVAVTITMAFTLK